MTTASFYAGLDVGGNAMKAGVVDDDGKPLATVSLPTEAHRGQEFGLARMCEAIREAVHAAGLTLDRIASVGVATPGLMDIPAGLMTDPPNLKPWRNVPVRDHVARTFGKPTAFQNDANAAAFGEYWAGAGRGVASLVFFTLGTGVGGGVVLDGKILTGRHSHGAELGHQKIEMTQPRQCTCGRYGCLEAYASAVAVVKRATEALAEEAGASPLRDRLRASGELSARDVFDAAALGDAVAARVVEQTAYYLAVGAMNAMHVIDPDVVV